MVLGEYNEENIEAMAESDDIREFYIDRIKEFEVDESDEVIINLALNYLWNELQEDRKNYYKICKECLVLRYLDLNDGHPPFDEDDDEEALTLGQILNNANSN